MGWRDGVRRHKANKASKKKETAYNKRIIKSNEKIMKKDRKGMEMVYC